jgi:hypothetical protein
MSEQQTTSTIGRVMEDAGTISRVPPSGFEALEVLEAGHAGEPSRGAERWAVLRRLLALGDVFAGLGAGTFAALVAGVPAANAVVLVACAALLCPALAFACGLYSGEDLRQPHDEHQGKARRGGPRCADEVPSRAEPKVEGENRR